MARSSNWLFCVYPDSLPDDWLDYIESTHVQTCISPIHDRDKNRSGDDKKPHYHVLVRFESLKSLEQVKEQYQYLDGTIPIICQSVRGSVRYFCHLDNPEKAQYKVEDIKVLNGFDVSEVNKPTDAQIYKTIKDIVKYIADNNICYYIDLLLMTMFDDTMPDIWGYTVAHNTTLFSGACSSLYKKTRGI